MAIQAAQLSAKISVDGAPEAQRKLRDVGEATHKTTHEFSMLKNALSFAGGQMLFMGARDVVGGLLETGRMAGDFQAGMTSLVTGAGEAAKNIGLVSAGILKMAVDTGTSTKQLTDGMYMIESAGFHGAAGLDVLKAAAEGAKVGNADLATVANGVTTIMVDYAKSHVSAAQATNMLVATVAAGKTHMQDLAAALSTIAPTAAAVGLKVTDMNAALATMTGEGTAAADASTYLRQLLISLDAPASQTVTTLREIGLTAAEVSDGMRKSLPDTLQMITDHLKKKFPEGSAAYVEAIKNIAGGARQMEGILQLTGTHLQVFKDNVTNITDAVKKGGDSISGWAKVQGDFNFQLDKGREMVQTLAIKVGTGLMPVMTDLLNRNIIPLIGRFSDWMTKGGGLQSFQTWATNISSFMQNQLLPAFDALLNRNIIPLAQQVGNLVMGAVHLFQAFQQGEPYANAIAIGIGAIGTAIALIKIEEFAAGWLNTFNAMSQGNGLIANMANKALPELGEAFGWAKTKAVETSVAVEGIGVASVEAEGVVVASSAAMTLAMGAATLGISLLVGAVIAGITADTIKGQTAMSETTKKSYDELGKTADDMTARQKADAAVTDVSWKTTSDGLSGRWAAAGEHMAKSSADASAKMILDQQAIADAAKKAADAATAAWSKWVNDMWAKGIDVVHGGKVPPQTGPTTLPGGPHLPGHASGILNSPFGHWATVGEHGPEPMWVPSGASILPNSALASGAMPPIVVQPPDIYLDGVRLSRGLMPYVSNAIRYGVGGFGQ